MRGVVAGLEIARRQAQEAADRARVIVTELSDARTQVDAMAIFDEVWPSVDGSTQVRPNLLRAIVHAGGYCVAAYDRASGEPMGATLALLGQTTRPEELGAPEPTQVAGPVMFLHSHMAGVRDSARNRHIGTAMKLHQRWWALRHDIGVVTWTFDPLVRRNAHLNVCKLGVQVAKYHVNFYGEMGDAINAGDPSDRIVAWWQVGSQRAEAAAAGAIEPINEKLITSGDDVRLVPTPVDIVQLRASDPGQAQHWRERVRELLLAAFGAGFVIDGFTDEGSYVLHRAAQEISPRVAS